MATVEPKIPIAAEAAEMLSTIGDGLDDLLLEIATKVATEKKHETISTQDIQAGISIFCEAIKAGLNSGAISTELRPAIEHVIAYLNEFGAKS